MNMKKIPNGYFVISRQIFDSSVMDWPSTWFKLWIWLIGQANHKDVRVRGVEFKRGQVLTSYKEMIDVASYHVGYRKEIPTKTVVGKFCEAIKKSNMATTRKTTRGFFIEIINYDYFQNPKNYEDDTEEDNKTTTEKQLASTINNNEKNEKKDFNICKSTEKSEVNKEKNNGMEQISSVLSNTSIATSTNGIHNEWQEKAFRYAKGLKIDLTDEIKPRWLKFFKVAYEKEQTSLLNDAYSYLSDYPTPLPNEEKVRMFFWRYYNPDGNNKSDK